MENKKFSDAIYKEAIAIKNFMEEELTYFPNRGPFDFFEVIALRGFEAESGFDFSVDNLLRALAVDGLCVEGQPSSLPSTRSVMEAIEKAEKHFSICVQDFYSFQDEDGEIINENERYFIKVDLDAELHAEAFTYSGGLVELL